jgi:hypothetical protein
MNEEEGTREDELSRETTVNGCPRSRVPGRV